MKAKDYREKHKESTVNPDKLIIGHNQLENGILSTLMFLALTT